MVTPSLGFGVLLCKEDTISLFPKVCKFTHKHSGSRAVCFWEVCCSMHVSDVPLGVCASHSVGFCFVFYSGHLSIFLSVIISSQFSCETKDKQSTSVFHRYRPRPALRSWEANLVITVWIKGKEDQVLVSRRAGRLTANTSAGHHTCNLWHRCRAGSCGWTV